MFSRDFSLGRSPQQVLHGHEAFRDKGQLVGFRHVLIENLHGYGYEGGVCHPSAVMSCLDFAQLSVARKEEQYTQTVGATENFVTK